MKGTIKFHRHLVKGELLDVFVYCPEGINPQDHPSIHLCAEGIDEIFDIADDSFIVKWDTSSSSILPYTYKAVPDNNFILIHLYICDPRPEYYASEHISEPMKDFLSGYFGPNTTIYFDVDSF